MLKGGNKTKQNKNQSQNTKENRVTQNYLVIIWEEGLLLFSIHINNSHSKS